MRYLLVYICILCFQLHLRGQYDTLQGRWIHYGIESGLRTNSIRCSTQDGTGFIWVGTDDGLYIFDGHVFREIENTVSPRMGFDKIIDLAYYPAKDLVIIATQGGLYTYFYDSRTLTQHDEIIVSSIAIDSLSERCYYVGRNSDLHAKSILGYLDLVDLSTHVLPGISEEENIRAISYDQSENVLWLGDSGLVRYDLNSSECLAFNSTRGIQADMSISSIVATPEYLFIGTIGSGLFLYEKSSKSWNQYFYDTNINDQAFNVIRHLRLIGDRLYVSTSDRGLGYFHTLTRNFAFYIYDSTDHSSITEISARSSFIDREGNLWASMAESLSLLAPEQNMFSLHQQELPKGLSSRSVREFYLIEEQGYILQATTGVGKLFIYDLQGIPVKDFLTYPPDGYEGVTLARAASGKLYAQGGQEIYEISISEKFVKKVFHEHDLPNDVQGKKFYRMLALQDTMVLWQSSRLLFLVETDKGLKYSHVEEIPSIDEVHVFDNELFVSDIISLKRRIGRDNYQVYQEISDSLYTGANSPLHLAYYDKEHIVIGTQQHGIAKMNIETGNFVMLDRSAGLATNVVTKLASDALGNIWALSSAGLLFYNKAHDATSVFTEKEGTFSTDLLPDIVQYLGNGIMALSIDHGLNLWRIDESQLSSPAPPIVIHTIGGLRAQNGIVFPSDTRQLDIAYSNFDYGLTDAHRFEYSLNGGVWNPVERAGSVKLIGTEAGAYEIKIRGVDGLGRRMQEAMIEFDVHPYWYQTSWFVFLALAAAFTGGFLLMSQVSKRRKQISEMENNYRIMTNEMENQMLRAQMNPHFLFNSLNSIRYFIISQEPDKAASYLTKFSRLIRLILENSNQKLVNLESELELVKLYVSLEQIRFDQKFDFEVHVDEQLLASNISIPPMIIQPFLENAILHGIHPKAERSKLSLSLSIHNADYLACTIVDDGIGREKAQKLKSEKSTNQKSLGMSITEKRLQMISNDYKDLITISNAFQVAEYVGTKVQVLIPINAENKNQEKT